jgi:hypothetical protein
MSVTEAMPARACSMKSSDEFMRACLARASSTVSARMGEIRNSTLTSSGLRPCATARARMSSRYSFMPSTPWAVAMMESAVPAANWRPLGDPPAWIRAGRPWGERTVFKGPRHLKNRPSKSTVCTLLGLDLSS